VWNITSISKTLTAHKVHNLRSCLSGDEGPSRVHNIHVQYQDLMQSFQQADNEVATLKHRMVRADMVNIITNYLM